MYSSSSISFVYFSLVSRWKSGSRCNCSWLRTFPVEYELTFWSRFIQQETWACPCFGGTGMGRCWASDVHFDICCPALQNIFCQEYGILCLFCLFFSVQRLFLKSDAAISHVLVIKDACAFDNRWLNTARWLWPSQSLWFSDYRCIWTSHKCEWMCFCSSYRKTRKRRSILFEALRDKLTQQRL